MSDTMCLCGCERLRHRVVMRWGEGIRGSCKDCGCDGYEPRDVSLASAPQPQPSQPVQDTETPSCARCGEPRAHPDSQLLISTPTGLVCRDPAGCAARRTAMPAIAARDLPDPVAAAVRAELDPLLDTLARSDQVVQILAATTALQTLVAALSNRLQAPGVPADGILLQYAAHWCPVCERRYRVLYGHHECGPLTPVTVTITANPAGWSA